MPRALPHPTLALAAWIAGGLLTLAGALTYAELGTMFPRAGGQYHYLKEAFGPFSGFLFGWASFWVAQSAANAAVAVAFGEYLGAFIPSISTANIILPVPIGSWTWQLNTVQLVGAAAIALLTVVNCLGLKEDAGVQNAFTVLKIGAVLLLCAAGFLVPAGVAIDWTSPLPSGNLAAAVGIAMVGVFGAYDGWYQATFTAGEIRDPSRNLPRGIAAGVLAIMVLYAIINVVYLRALPLADLAASPRIGESAAVALLGPRGRQLMALAVLLALFGSLSAGILSAARIYLPMAEDGLFHTATGVALFRLRRDRPDASRPYRVSGYPWVPGLFVVTSLLFVVNALVTSPVDSLIGVGIVALGLPAYLWWRRAANQS